MIAGVGVDLCAVSRIEESIRHAPGFLARFFAAEECEYVRGRAGGMESAAAMFAAKEAFAKALGTGLIGLELRDIAVLHDGAGAPYYAPRGTAAAALAQKGVKAAHLSLTHEGGMAAAVCVLED